MPDPDPAEEEVRRLIAALRTAIRLGGISQRQIEREIGLSTGYLTRILAGQVQLRLGHVLAICRVIGFPAGSFFASLYPPRPPAGERETRLIRGLARIHPEPVPPSDPLSLFRTLRATLDSLEDQILVVK